MIDRPKCKHSTLLLDLLTHIHVAGLSPRPCCVQHGQHSNTEMFNAGECRLKLKHVACTRHTDLIACHVCLGAGRLGQIRIEDVMSPDMFVSGHSAVAECMQGMTDSLLEGIDH
jgi:hypothetical protein